MNLNINEVPRSCASTITNEYEDTNRKMKELEDENENFLRASVFLEHYFLETIT